MIDYVVVALVILVGIVVVLFWANMNSKKNESGGNAETEMFQETEMNNDMEQRIERLEEKEKSLEDRVKMLEKRAEALGIAVFIPQIPQFVPDEQEGDRGENNEI